VNVCRNVVVRQGIQHPAQHLEVFGRYLSVVMILLPNRVELSVQSVKCDCGWSMTQNMHTKVCHWREIFVVHGSRLSVCSASC